MIEEIFKKGTDTNRILKMILGNFIFIYGRTTNIQFLNESAVWYRNTQQKN